MEKDYTATNANPHPEPSRSARHGLALRIAKHGIPVFPCNKKKEPLCARGFLAASRQPAQVNAWWNRFHGAEPAIPTGKASGFFVVDWDPKADGPSFAEVLHLIGLTTPTRVVQTPSGGMHIYLKYPSDAGREIRNSASRIARGVDVRGEGGYVMAPGADNTEGRYKVVDDSPIAEAPERLVELLTNPTPPSGGGGRHVRPDGSGRPRPLPARVELVPYLEGSGPIPEGIRNTVLFFAALDLKDQGHTREQAVAGITTVNDERCAPPLDENDVHKLVRSAFRYPLRGTSTPPEVAEAVAGLTALWWATDYKGMGEHSERDVVRILIKFGERHGQLTPAGLRVPISWRELALAAGMSFGTLCRTVKRLKVAGILRSDNAFRTGADRGAFVLARTGEDSRALRSPRKKEDALSVLTSARTTQKTAALPTQTPCFRHGGYVGKAGGGVLNVFDVFGKQSSEEVAERLGYARPRDLERRILRSRWVTRKRKGLPDEKVYKKGLIELGLVVEVEPGIFDLAERYEEKVAEVRSLHYGARKKKVESADHERVVVHVVEIPARSEIERDEADQNRYDDHRQEYQKHLLRQVEDLGEVVFLTTELERVSA